MKLVTLLAILPLSANAITSAEFVENRKVEKCYVQRDSRGDIRQVIYARYGKPEKTPLGWSREVRGDMQPTDAPQATAPLYGVASYYTLTTDGAVRIQLNLSMRIGPVTNNMVYFFDDPALESWEALPCR